MPEGPEVRRYAVQLAAALEGQEIIALTARTREAKQWLLEHHERVVGRKVLRIRSHGKHLYGCIEGGFGFHAHLMMWGRWLVREGNEDIPADRRERARIATPAATALLYSAPVFDLFSGDPYDAIPYLDTLGPDILPYDGVFDAEEFRRRLLRGENLEHEIGAVLLDQRVAAGIGNYLRAEMLFFCRLDPWKRVGELTEAEWACLAEQTPLVARRALLESGATVPEAMRQRLRDEPELSYAGRGNYGVPGYGTRHAVFRRTNLPCLVCGSTIRQTRQRTYHSADGDEENEPGEERSRIIYFCPVCQGVGEERYGKKRAKKKTVPLS